MGQPKSLTGTAHGWLRQPASYLSELLEKYRGHRAQIASILGISERNIYRLINRQQHDKDASAGERRRDRSLALESTTAPGGECWGPNRGPGRPENLGRLSGRPMRARYDAPSEGSLV